MKKLLLGVVFAAFSLSPALAADPVVEDALPVASTYNWTGFYVGANIGYGFGDSQHFNGPGAATDEFDIDGIIGGGSVGYNWQFGSFVAGLEATFSAADIEGETETSATFGCSINNECRTEVDWLATGEARLGYAFDNILPYVAGGVAIGSLDAFIPGAGIFGDDFESSPSTEVGFVVGGGVDWAINDKWVANIAYQYVDFGEHEYENGTFNGETFDADVNFSVVKVGVKYRF